jgi:hypothetical protein
MRDLTKVFIEQYINLITENKFEDLYRIALRESVVIEDLTNSLLKADIYPLEHMSYVPQEFFYKSTKSIDGFIIPHNIVDIRERSFYETDLTEITIPEGVQSIYTLAFARCKNLLFVTIPHSIEFIDRAVFTGCESLVEIRYNGTIEEWNKIDRHDKWLSISSVLTAKLICKDGELWVR